jgi:hypothetical protein
MADVADTQPSSRKEHGAFEIGHLDDFLPFLGPDTAAAAKGFFVARRVAADVMKIKRRKEPIPTQLMILRAIGAVEKIEQALVFDHMTVSVDDLVVHGNTLKINWSVGVLEYWSTGAMVRHHRQSSMPSFLQTLQLEDRLISDVELLNLEPLNRARSAR